MLKVVRKPSDSINEYINELKEKGFRCVEVENQLVCSKPVNEIEDYVIIVLPI